MENMPDRYDVENFLNDFKYKTEIFQIFFRDDRSKNTTTLAELGITSNDRIKIIKQLEVESYSEGPIRDRLYGNADMWIFGTIVQGHEIYIKISMGIPNNKTICSSFHITEYPMNYPFKI